MSLLLAFQGGALVGTSSDTFTLSDQQQAVLDAFVTDAATLAETVTLAVLGANTSDSGQLIELGTATVLSAAGEAIIVAESGSLTATVLASDSVLLDEAALADQQAATFTAVDADSFLFGEEVIEPAPPPPIPHETVWTKAKLYQTEQPYQEALREQDEEDVLVLAAYESWYA